MSDQQLFYQLQSQTLAGAGCVIGDTTIILNSFVDINGTTLVTMADIGTKGWMTIEPDNATQEEQISFTGITQNANGTATLTGVKNVLFKSPYTETSGVLKTHPGGVKCIISNTSGFYDQLTSKDNDEIVSGKWTFTQSPDVPTPISASTTAAASVQYVNNIAIAGAPKAATNVFGISELSTAPVLASVPIVVGDNDTRMLTQSENDAAVGNSSSVVPSSSTNVFVTQQGFQRNQERYAVATGTSLALVVALSPTPVALIAGMQVSFKSPVTTSTPVTLNVNSLGAKSLVKLTSGGTAALVLGDIATNVIVLAEYDGAAFQMISPVSKIPVSYTNGTTTNNTTSTTQTIAHGLGVVPKNVRLSFVSYGNGTTALVGSALSVYNGIVQNSIWGMGYVNTSPNVSVVGSGTGVVVGISTGFVTGVITFDATNISIVWTLTGSGAPAAQVLWEAFA